MRFLTTALILLTISLAAIAKEPCNEYDPLCGLDGETIDLPDPVVIITNNNQPSDEQVVEDEVAVEDDTEEDEALNEVLGLSKAPVLKVEKKSCRNAVVEAKKILGEVVDPDSFSTKTFADLGLSVEEFNELSIEEQQKLYRLITPMPVMVESTIAALNNNIAEYSGTLFEIIFADMLMNMRAARDNLKICIEE